MTEGGDPLTNLKQQCAAALAAFDLCLDEQIVLRSDKSGNLLVFKQDQESTVLQVRCIEDGVSKPFIAKRRSGQNNLVALALTARLERLLTDAAARESSQPLIPHRRLTDSGAAFWIEDQKSGCSDTCCWSVSQYIAHAPALDWLEEQPSWTPAHAGAAGELLAKLHCAGRQAKSKLSAEEKDQLASDLPSLPPLLRSSLKSGSPPGSGQRSQALLTALDQALDQAVTALTSGAYSSALADEQLIVHGDFHPGNVLFTGTAAPTAIDLDYAHLEHPLYDLAYALLMFAPTSETAACAVSLVDGYRQYFERAAEPLPSFLPQAVELESSFNVAMKDSSQTEGQLSPFRSYLVVAASLIFLWTLAPAGLSHRRVETVAASMIRRILAD